MTKMKRNEDRLLRSNTAAARLRIAAADMAAGLHQPCMDARDSAFVKLDRRLQRAAVAFARAINLRGRSVTP